MFAFICLFFPTFISLLIFKKRYKKEYRDLIFIYPIYNIIINGLSIIFTCLYLKSDSIIVSEVFDNAIFCCKYLLLSCFISFIIPFIFEFVSKNINIKIDFRKNTQK